MKTKIVLPPGFFPPGGFEMFGRQVDGTVKNFVIRTTPRDMLEVVWKEGFEIPGDFAEYFNSCLGGQK